MSEDTVRYLRASLWSLDKRFLCNVIVQVFPDGFIRPGWPEVVQLNVHGGASRVFVRDDPNDTEPVLYRECRSEWVTAAEIVPDP